MAQQRSLQAILEVVQANATVGEISDAMCRVFGEYQETVADLTAVSNTPDNRPLSPIYKPVNCDRSVRRYFEVRTRASLEDRY